MRTTSAIIFCAYIFIGLVSATPAYAQPSIQGRIIDASTQQPVGKASITALRSGTSRTAILADENGTFEFDLLEEGLYQILVEAEGYEPTVSGEIRVVSQKTAVTIFELVRRSFSETVVVTPPMTAGTSQESVSFTNYNREEIRRAPGSAGDVMRAVDSLPGVAATGQFASFSVRGRGPRDNLILVDGIPFDKVIHFDQTLGEQEDIEGGGRFSIFAPNLIQNIKFQPGGFPVAFGGKNGSLLQLEVAEGNPLTPSVSGRAEITGWEFNYDGPSYIFDNTAVLFSARAQNFGRLFRLIGQEQIGEPSLEDVIFKTTTELNARHRVKILGIHAPERYHRDIQHVLASENFENTFIARTSQDSNLVGLNWQWLTGTSSFLTNTFFVRNSDKNSIQGDSFPEVHVTPLSNLSDITVRDEIFNVREKEREYGWRSDFVYLNGKNDRLSLGSRITQVTIDYEINLDRDLARYVFDSNDFRLDTEKKFIILRPEQINSQFHKQAVRSVLYSDYGFTFGSKLTATPGLRLEHDGLTKELLWSPRASVTLDLDPLTRLNFSGGILYQYPQFLQLASNPINASLNNERSRQVSFGFIRTLTNDLRISVETYYQFLDRLIVKPDRTTATSSNSGTGRSAGIDMLLSKRLIDDWYGQVSYSFQQSRRNDNLGQDSYYSDFNRPHILNTLLAYEFNDSWSVAGKWRFATGRPTDTYIIHENVHHDTTLSRFSKEITGRNITRMPNFHTLNVRVDYRQRFKRLSLILFLDFINIYGHKNVDSLRFQERTGENIEQGLEGFPTFGIKFEF